jgi:hypothetical protein
MIIVKNIRKKTLMKKQWAKRLLLTPQQTLAQPN